MKNFLTHNQGQAVTEFVVCASLLILFIFGIVQMSKLLIIKEKTIESVRYATFHQLRNNEKGSILENTIAEKFFNNQQEVSVQTGNKGATIENDLQAPINTFLKTSDIQPRSLYCKIECPVSSPFLPEPAVISEENYIKGNSWNGYDIDIHDIRDAVIEIFKKPLAFIF